MSYNPVLPKGQATMANSNPVVIASDQSTLPIAAVDTTATGNISALNGTVSISCAGVTAVSVTIAGTWVGTITYEISGDGTTFYSIPSFDENQWQTIPTTTSNTTVVVRVGGFNTFRVRMSAYTSGTANVTLRAGEGDGWPLPSVVHEGDGSTSTTQAVLISAYNPTGTEYRNLRLDNWNYGLAVAGDTPANNSDGAAPISIGGKASSSVPTAVSNAFRVNGWFDLNGRFHVTGDSAMSPLLVAGDVASGSADSGNPVKVGTKFNATVPTFTDGQRGDLQMSSRGSLKVQLMDSGINTINFSADNADAVATSATANGLKGITRNTVYNGTTWDRMYGDATNGVYVQIKAPTTGGLSINRIYSAASTNATSIKASAGQVYSIIVSNIATYQVYLKLYNKASAPTVGTDTPVITITIQPTSTITWDTPLGVAFGTGIAAAITKFEQDSDTTVVGANDCVANIFYK